MDIIIKGLVTGFILSIMIGPVFFVLLETSIRKGVKAAIAFDVGVLISDLLYIAIAYIFYSEVKALQEGDDSSILSIVGGSLFIIYGIFNLFKKVKDRKVRTRQQREAKHREYLFLALKGFVLNIANPLIVFYWFSVMTLGSSSGNPEDGGYRMILFISCILITFFCVDLLKIIGAKQLRPLVTNRVLVGLNRLIGIVFVVFGIVLIVQGVVTIIGNAASIDGL